MTVRELPADVDEGLDPATLAAALDDRVAVVVLSHVAYRSGALADLAAITRQVHDAGALVLWDLSHAVGAVPVELAAAGADLAVGCTYKYLNGGPGAPAFLYVRRDLQEQLRSPIQGWFGQRDQFAMGPVYEPAAGIERFGVGTPPVLAMAAVEVGVRLIAEAGIERLAAKGRALTRADRGAGRRLARAARRRPRLAARPGPPRIARHVRPPAGVAADPGADRPRRGAGLPDARPGPARARRRSTPGSSTCGTRWTASGTVLDEGAQENYPAERARVT